MATREGELFVEKIEVNLDSRQIFCLFCGGAVIASLVFVLGVTVGRRVEAREHGVATATASASSDPLTALDGAAADDGAGQSDLAFASTLRGEREGDPLGAVDRSLDRPAPGKPPVVVPGKGELGAKEEPGAEARPAAKADAKADARADAKADARADVKPDSKADAKPEAKPPARPEVKAEPAAVAKPEVQAVAAAPVEASGDSARFTLHLSSFQDRAQADELVGKLKKAGYQPYVVETAEDGKGTAFRVRVGHFADFESAVAGKADFERKQQIIAYVTRTRR
jgi:cell division septation protein DedD